MSKPTLALIPSGYKSGTVYSILPNDGDGDFDYERDGNATRVRKDGLIEELTVDDTPRLDWYNSDCPSLLLEPQRVNRQVYSEQIDNALWSKVNITVTSNDLVAPNGEYTADKVQRTSTSASYVTDSASKSSASQLDVTTSMFIKKGEGDFFAIRQQGVYPNRGEVKYQFSTNTLTTSVAGSDFTVVSSSAEDYGNGWIRISATFNTDANATVGTIFSPRATDGTVDASDTSDSAYAYVWGVQVEEGVGATSYIKTESSTVTRLADECNGSGNADLFNDSEGVLYAEISALANDGTFRMISISDGTNDNRVRINYTATSNQIASRVVDGGVTQADFTHSLTDSTDFVKLAIYYKNNDCAFWVNGVKTGTDTAATMPSGLDTLNLNGGGGSPFYGKVKDLRYFDRALTDAELTELTT